MTIKYTYFGLDVKDTIHNTFVLNFTKHLFVVCLLLFC